jgi:hypothetical protein
MEETMFGTWDRFPPAIGRRHRDVHASRHAGPMDTFLVNVDRMFYAASAALAAYLIAMLVM